jgi:predicted kinase
MITTTYALPKANKPLTINKHTVLILSGPSDCGKTHFSDHVKSELTNYGWLCSSVSTDDCRRELLQKDTQKHHATMMPISGPAFELAYAKLRGFTTYPVNHDVVIFDSTALNIWSRNKISDIAKDNGYTTQNISFDYADDKEYYRHTDADWLVDIHLKLFKKDKPKTGYKITNRILPLVLPFQAARNIHLEGDMIVIGDVHGCYDQLIELLTKLDALKDDVIDKTKNVVFVGDLVDKGPKSEAVVDFILPNVVAGNCHVVIGNHENYLIKRWAGDTGLKYFDSHSLGTGFRQKLQEICLRGYSYVCGDHCVVTHSPSSTINLTKDSKSKEMRNLRHSCLTKEELAAKLVEMAAPRTKYFPKHIFGHIEFAKPYENKGMIGIDTGAVSGGRLTAIKLSDENHRFVSVDGYQK